MRRSLLVHFALTLPLLVIWTGCATARAAPESGLQESAPSDVSGLPDPWTLHRIADPEAAEHTAFSLLVPEGWAVEGGLNWSSPELYAMPTLLDVRVAGPDGRAARLYPQLAFSYGQEFAGLHQPGQPTAKGTLYLPPPEELGAWLAELARANPAPRVSGVKLLEQSPLPEATAQFQALRRASYEIAEQTNRMYEDVYTPQPMRQGFAAQADRVVLGYQRDGLAVREALIVFREGWWVTQGEAVAVGGWSITGMLSAAGPIDSAPLRDPELVAIVRSSQPTAYWIDLMADFQRKIARLAHPNRPGHRPWSVDTQALNREARQANARWRDLMMDAWHEAAGGAGDEPSRNLIKTYALPDGEKLKLPADFTGVVTDDTRRYLIDDDAVYDPDTDAPDTSDWQRLEPLLEEPRPIR